MEFSTPTSLPNYQVKATYNDKILLLGSCFVENIGKKLDESKFQVCVNPFGTLYNPCSVASSIQTLLDRKIYKPSDLFKHGGCFHSFDHHSRFSSVDEEDCLRLINRQMSIASDYITNAKFLFVTFGSAYIYRLKENNRIVANCHKLPDRQFIRELLTVEDITELWSELIQKLRMINPDLRILFTVSPIRHLKDGAHGNQISKATLILAVQQLMERHPESADYFPAYEIMLDELRDYRFYAEDMVHPSNQAIQYIWNQFVSCFMTSDTKEIMHQWEEIQKAMNHKPFQPESEAYQKFILQTMLKIEQITKKIPSFDTQNELKALKSKLK